MYRFIRPLLFKLDPEQAHRLTLKLVGVAGRLPPVRAALISSYRFADPRLEVELFRIRFQNPIGLAAGYDKDGVAVAGLSALGFGHIEIGTVTCLPQVGNPRPRVWRVPTERALINSMGFPNVGVDALRIPTGLVPVGINIGKGKDTPLERAATDYTDLLRRVYKAADYVAVNVSSPNTLGLRQLQARAAMDALLRELTLVRDSLTPRVPLLVKIAPDLTWPETDDVLASIRSSGVDGIIATNTTVSRRGMPEWAQPIRGGLSGAPLRARSTEVIRYVSEQTKGQLPVIGVGGVASGADALDKLRAGASLVQVYTGLVYEGPGLVKQINEELVRECERVGAKSVADLRSA